MKDLFRHSIKTAFKHKSSITLIYVVTFIMSIILGLIVWNGLQQDIGNSLALDEMTNGFNRTVIEDWMSKHAATIGTIQNTAILSLSCFLLLSIFLNTALLSNIVLNEYNIKRFVINGARHFFPFLGITLIGLAILGCCLAIMYLPYISIIGSPLEDYRTEVPFIYSLFVMALLTTILFINIWAWSIMSKAHYITNKSFWQSIKHGAQSLIQQFWKVLFAGLLLFFVGFLIWFLFIQLSSSHSAGSWTLLILVFVLSQFLVWLRVFFRAFGYRVLVELRRA